MGGDLNRVVISKKKGAHVLWQAVTVQYQEQAIAEGTNAPQYASVRNIVYGAFMFSPQCTPSSRACNRRRYGSAAGCDSID